MKEGDETSGGGSIPEGLTSSLDAGSRESVEDIVRTMSEASQKLSALRERVREREASGDAIPQDFLDAIRREEREAEKMIADAGEKIKDLAKTALDQYEASGAAVPPDLVDRINELKQSLASSEDASPSAPDAAPDVSDKGKGGYSERGKGVNKTKSQARRERAEKRISDLRDLGYDDATIAGLSTEEKRSLIARGVRFEGVKADALDNQPTPDIEPPDPEPSETPTHKESKERLQNLRARLFPELDAEERKSLSGKEVYERRAAEFAERHGLTEDRDALLNAENIYRAAMLDNYKKRKGVTSREREAEQAYMKALHGWRMKLGELAETLDDTEATTERRQREDGRVITGFKTLGMSEKKEALVLQKRDTILRPASLETDTRLEALDARKKTAFGKVESFVGGIPAVALKAVNAPTSFAGTKMAEWFHKNDTPARRAEMAQHYARAARILGGATFATLAAVMATPVAVPTALGFTAVFAARSAAGMAIGAGAAKSAGLIYRIFGNKAQRELKKSGRVMQTSIKNYEDYIERYKRGNALERKKHKTMWQMGAGVVAGGGAGFLSAPIAHEMLDRLAGLDSVQQSGDTLSEAGAEVQSGIVGPESAEQPTERGIAASGSGTLEADAASAADKLSENLLKGSIIERGEGFNSLFSELQENVRAISPELAESSPVVARLMELSPTELSELVNTYDPDTGASMVMQPGDQLYLNDDGNLVFERIGEDPREILVLENGQAVERPFEDPVMMGGRPAPAEVERVPEESASESAGSLTEDDAPMSADAPVVSEDEIPAPIAGSDLVTGTDDEQVPLQAPVGDAGPVFLGDFINHDPATALGPQNPNEGYSDAASVGPARGVETIDDILSRSQDSLDTYVNSHNVEVSASTPHAYELAVPGTNETFPTVFGGDSAAVEAWVMRELELNPTAELFVTHTEVSSVSGRPESFLGRWSMGADGEPVFDPVVRHPMTNARLGAADPEQFTRRIS